MTAAIADTAIGGKYRASGWIVVNTETRGHRVFPTKRQAQAIVDGWPRQMRLMPMIGRFNVNQPFVDFACDLLA